MSARAGGSDERLLSIEEFARLPEEPGRMELVRGRVVHEPPAGFEHGEIWLELATRLRTFVRERGLGTAVGADTGFILAEVPPTVRAPDAAFVSSRRLAAGRPVGFAPFPPDLAVEVLSPSDTLAGIREKVRDYLAAGSHLVWVVEPRNRQVRVCRTGSDERVLGAGDVLDGEDVVPGFRVPVADLFG